MTQSRGCRVAVSLSQIALRRRITLTKTDSDELEPFEEGADHNLTSTRLSASHSQKTCNTTNTLFLIEKQSRPSRNLALDSSSELQRV